jgi:hypothetical protein
MVWHSCRWELGSNWRVIIANHEVIICLRRNIVIGEFKSLIKQWCLLIRISQRRIEIRRRVTGLISLNWRKQQLAISLDWFDLNFSWKDPRSYQSWREESWGRG